MNTYTVGELARMAGVTVRTLHHYDEIGLLPPRGRTQAGYRLYDDSDVDRLRAVLTYRELGLGLEEVARAVTDQSEAKATLRDAHERINMRIARLEAISASLARALQEPTHGGAMTPEEKLKVFGGFDPDEHREEAAERWGDTVAFAEAARRTGSYSQEDWQAINVEAADIYDRFFALLAAGVPADSDEAAALVDEHRAHITRWYYECSPQIHQGLGQMYTADFRFTRNIDRGHDGLAEYLSEAIAIRYA